MLETIAIILLILWALGLVSSYTMGGFIHILLVFAVITALLLSAACGIKAPPRPPDALLLTPHPSPIAR